MVYEVLHVTNTEHASAKYPPDVIYRNFNGRLLSARLSEWSSNYTRCEPTQEAAKAMAITPHVPKPGEYWVHSNGNVYCVQGVTNTHDDDRNPPDVFYRGRYGSMWSRRLVDWHPSLKPVT
jgi:hypothetical protein